MGKGTAACCRPVGMHDVEGGARGVSLRRVPSGKSRFLSVAPVKSLAKKGVCVVAICYTMGVLARESSVASGKELVMKRFLMAGSLLGAMIFAGCSLSPEKVAIPVDTWVAQVGVGAQFVPATESWTLLRVAPFWMDRDRVCFLSAAGVSSARAHGGLTVGGMNFADSGWGVSVGALVDSCEDHTGVRVGAITCGGKQDGVQIGLFNWCREDSHALQLGLINWNGYFAFPIVNIACGGKGLPEPGEVEIVAEPETPVPAPSTPAAPEDVPVTPVAEIVPEGEAL